MAHREPVPGEGLEPSWPTWPRRSRRRLSIQLQHPGRMAPEGPAFPARVERATLRFGGACSFLLSYGNVVPGEGLEPSWARWPSTF